MDFHCFAWSACDKFFKNASWTPLSASSHHSRKWPSFVEALLWKIFSSSRGLSRQTWHTCDHFHPCVSHNFLAFLLKQNVGSLSTKLCSVDKSTLFSQNFFFPGKWICCVWNCLPSSRRVMAFPFSILLDFANVAVLGHLHRLLGTLARSYSRLFSLARCRNLRERRQDLRARDSQCLSDFSSR